MTQENTGNPAPNPADRAPKAAPDPSGKAVWSTPTLNRLEARETLRIVPQGSAKAPHPQTPEEMMFLGS